MLACRYGHRMGSGYSLKKGIGVGKFVQSATFSVGGYDWAISFFPDGISSGTKTPIAFALVLKTRNATARAAYDLRLLKKDSVLPGLGIANRIPTGEPRVFVYATFSRYEAMMLPESIDLANLGYIKDDRITVQCVVTVVKELQVTETRWNSEIEVPPSDITGHLGKLLETKQGADVIFSVGGEAFAAHKIVLAMRSPVFQAQLCGQMMEAMMSCVTIKDVQPDVFRGLLHFIYTDSLPDMGDLEGDDNSEMIWHLLVAADKYAMDRLKLLCQNILGKRLDVENVATTLALADQNNCSKLKQFQSLGC
ncbi:hypothetical protein E2562_009757 [Oryza meyeriana var. granulata]|uniref:BTB domain-containing protein n=1 Tax=Oryza meyeriana var. granulata TaxID=110450 RepID=A0A6G1D1W7_9ORYZ|nr:hypothetical protein E2562_009757 [Oryza meyeriana var. granulata]